MRRFRDKQLMDDIFGTLRKRDSMLVCVETVTRVLELGHMLDQMRLTEDLLNNVAFNAGGGFQKGVDVTKRKIRDILPNEGFTTDVIENVLENIDVEDPFAVGRSQLERETDRISSSKHHSSLVEEALDDESDSDTEMEVVTKDGDAKSKVIKAETGKKQSGFFKSIKSKFPMFPCVV